MQKLSRLRHLSPHPAALLATEENNYDDTQIANHGPAPNPTAAAAVAFSTRTTMRPAGEDEGFGKHGLPAPLIAARSRKPSLLLEGSHDDDETGGCMDAVSAFLLAIASAPPAANKPESQQVGGVLPQLLRASKGAGSIESRDSAGDLLRFFGHSPVLHLEAVVWIKASGERGDGLQRPNRQKLDLRGYHEYVRSDIFLVLTALLLGRSFTNFSLLRSPMRSCFSASSPEYLNISIHVRT